MRRVVVPTSSLLLLVAYFLAPAGWFRPATPAAPANVQVHAEDYESDDPYDTDAAWKYRRGQVKHWRMLVINH